MDYSELMKQMQSALNTYQGNPVFGTSFRDQWRNAGQGQNVLGTLTNDDDVSEEQRNALASGLKSMKGSAVAGGIISGISGASNILSTSLGAAKIQDTSRYQNQIADLSRAGAFNYNNYDQLANDMAMTDFNVGIDYDKIRGMGGKGVTKEKIGAVGSSALSGAATGLQIGGPWGAAIGAVVGGGAALAGILSGDKKAQIEEGYLNLQAQRAQISANENFDAAHERISDTNNRYNMVNAVANGGQIKRRKQSIMEYADKVTRTPHLREQRPFGIVSKKCNGGIMVRLKAK